MAHLFQIFLDVQIGRDACVWQQQARLSASDRRTGQLFGTSVAIDDKEGLAVVGTFQIHHVKVSHTSNKVPTEMTSFIIDVNELSNIQIFKPAIPFQACFLFLGP